GIDVVVRRRRDQAHTRGRMAHPRDPRIHLAAGKLPALTGLGALRHLDLQLARLAQVEARHAEAPRGHLLDCRVLRIAELVGPRVALGVLAALARVGLAADAVHRDGERLVRLLADGAVAHGAGLEAL